MADPTPADVIAELRRLRADLTDAKSRGYRILAEDKFAAAMVTHADALLAIAEALADIIARVDADDEPYTQSPEDAALEQRSRAALARLAPTTKETDR